METAPRPAPACMEPRATPSLARAPAGLAGGGSTVTSRVLHSTTAYSARRGVGARTARAATQSRAPAPARKGGRALSVTHPVPPAPTARIAPRLVSVRTEESATQ